MLKIGQIIRIKNYDGKVKRARVVGFPARGGIVLRWVRTRESIDLNIDPTKLTAGVLIDVSEEN